MFKMIKKTDCVSKEIARLLKNKNINIDADTYFAEIDKNKYDEVWDDGQMLYVKKHKYTIYYTPLLYDVQQYFIKKHNILIVISNNECGFYWVLHRVDDGQIIKIKNIQETGGHKSYQTALNDAIKCILENILI